MMQKKKKTSKQKNELIKTLKALNLPYEFPPQLLSQIKENSMGGFFLCTISEDGSPMINFDVENDISAIAFVSHISRWAGLMKNLHDSVFCYTMMPKNGETEGPELLPSE